MLEKRETLCISRRPVPHPATSGGSIHRNKVLKPGAASKDPSETLEASEQSVVEGQEQKESDDTGLNEESNVWR